MLDTQTAVRLLVTLLARSDARFVPVRASECGRPLGGLYAAQWEFLELGLLPTGGGSALQRKRHQRLIDDLVGRGVLLAAVLGKARYVRLSDVAEDRIRRRCGLPGLWFAYETLRREFAYDRLERTEWYLAGGRGWGDGERGALLEVEARMAPALCRRLVRADSSIRGHVVYSLVCPYEAIPTWPDDPADGSLCYDDTLVRLYYSALKTERQRLLEGEAAGELGFIPAPTSAVTTLYQRDMGDLANGTWGDLAALTNRTNVGD